MADATLGTVLRQLRRLGAPRPGDGLSDGQLLDDFLRRRDEAAFAALVRRHGPMVLGVCRRVLRHAQDADDAFQATFLVLVRRADSIRRHDSCAGWLYGVALRTAQRAKLDAARRRRREERAAAPALRPPPDEADWRDLRAVLDEEIAGLPEQYRAPLVLCHLEGHTNVQAARRLRVPLGSLSKRLARARGLLRGRLLRRGVALSAAGLLTILAGQGGAAVPPPLARAAAGTALLALAGGASGPAPVAALADGVTRALCAGPVKGWLLGLAALGLLIGGGMLVAGRLGPAPPSGEPPAQRQPAVPREREPAPEKEPPRRGRKELDEVKQRLLRRGGGNAKSEAAVAAGLLWLAKQQAKDGSWSPDASGGQKNDVAGTAFGLLPLLGAGHTHTDDKDPFANNVQRGLDYLIGRQGRDGNLGGGMYAHALASGALFQAYALSGDPKLAAPAGKALDYIVQAQHEAGGWRYTPGTPGDLSVSAWQVAALHDARAAGLDVPQKTLDAAVKFVQSCRTPDGGSSYMPGAGTAAPTMTAAGLASGARLGEGAGEASFREGVRVLTKTAPGATQNTYHDQWATQALWRHGGDEWEAWNAKMRDLIVSRQEADGGWPAKGEPYGPAGGRLMISSLALLTLEVYYRDDLPLASVPARSLKAAELEDVWADLAADDPVKARRGLWSLVGSPKQALPLLDEALAPRPRPAVDDKRVARLIADLDDDSFDVRQTASAALEKLGAAADPALRKALKQAGSAESRRRLEILVAKLDGARFTPEHRRALRAVEVLEHVDTPEAQRLLTRLAKEWGDVELARAAKAALGRLAESPAGQR